MKPQNVTPDTPATPRARGGLLHTLLTSTLAATAALLFAASARAQPYFHPGHYVSITAAGGVTTGNVDGSFRGAHVIYYWWDLEPTTLGAYTWTKLDQDINTLNAINNQSGGPGEGGTKQLFIFLKRRDNTPGTSSSPFPDYLNGNSTYGGGSYKDKLGKWDLVTWNANVLVRYQALIAALRTHLNNTNLTGSTQKLITLVEGICFGETAQAQPATSGQSWTVQAYSDTGRLNWAKGIISRARDSDAFLDRSVIQFFNSDSSDIELLAHMKTEGAGIGGPDVTVQSLNYLNNDGGPYDQYPKFSNLTPVGPAVQAPDFGMGSDLHTGDANSDELGDLAQTNLKANYLFWVNWSNFTESLAYVQGKVTVGDPAGGLSTQVPKSFAGAPTAPTWAGAAALTVTRNVNGSIKLDWPSATGASGYRIERKVLVTAGSNQGEREAALFSLLASPGAGAVTYTDSTTVAGTKYDYRVRAINSAGNYSPYLVPPSNVVAATATREISVNGSDNSLYGGSIGRTILDGQTTTKSVDDTDYGSASIASGSTTRTYTIRNQSLTSGQSLTGISVSITGTNAADFTVTASPAGTLAPGGSTNFTITFNPVAGATGARIATVTVLSNDANEGTYTFKIEGNAT